MKVPKTASVAKTKAPAKKREHFATWKTPTERKVAAEVKRDGEEFTKRNIFLSMGDFAALVNLGTAPDFDKMTPTQLRNSYLRIPLLTTIIHSIAMQVANLTKTVVDLGTGDEINQDLATHLFEEENVFGESYEDIIMRSAIDTLVLNRGAIELIGAVDGSIKEWRSLDAAIFLPSIDNDTRTLRGFDEYTEQVSPTTLVGKAPKRTVPIEKFIWFELYPKTWTRPGESIIISIADQLTIILNSFVKAIRDSGRDPVPPGILTFEEIAPESYDRLRESIEAGEEGLKVADQVKNAVYTTFGNAGSAEVRQQLLVDATDTVMRAFGIPLGVRRGEISSLEEAAKTSFLVSQLSQHMEKKINIKLRKHLSGKLAIQNMPALTPREWVMLVRGFVAAPNEARQALGLDPVAGGNSIFMVGPQGVIQLDKGFVAPTDMEEKEEEEEEVDSDEEDTEE